MKKSLFFIFHFSFFIFFSFARDLSPNEERALSYLRELSFEITRYNITGHSPIPESAALSKISRVGTNLMARRKVLDSILNPVYLCEFYFPEKIGIIDSTFRDEDLYSVIEENYDNESEDFDSEIPEFDWVDQVILGLNVPEGFVANSSAVDYGIIDGEKLLEILEKGNSRGIEAQDEGGKSDDTPKEYTYAKKDGSLRRFSYNGEQFTIWNEGTDTILVNFYGEKLIRKTFDTLYRLTKSENFKIGASAKDLALENLTEYGYYPESTVLEKSLSENYSTKKRSESHFDKAGRNISLLESHYEEREIKSKKKKKDDEKTETETILLNDKKTSKSYDEKGRVLSEETVTWSYRTNTFGRNITEERKIKNVYDYSTVTEKNKLPPNLQFFENDELHLERKFSAAGNYSERLYFDGGFSVEVLYEDGMKKTEIIYLNNVEQRRREFEY